MIRALLLVALFTVARPAVAQVRAVPEIPLVLVLWTDAGFAGKKHVFVQDVARFGDCEGEFSPFGLGRCTDGPAFNDRASSIGVHPGPSYAAWKASHGGREPTVTLFEHAHYGGRSITLTAGAYADLRAYGFNDVVSSFGFNITAASAHLPATSAASPIGPIPVVVVLEYSYDYGTKRAWRSVTLVETSQDVLAEYDHGGRGRDDVNVPLPGGSVPVSGEPLLWRAVLLQGPSKNSFDVRLCTGLGGGAPCKLYRSAETKLPVVIEEQRSEQEWGWGLVRSVWIDVGRAPIQPSMPPLPGTATPPGG